MLNDRHDPMHLNNTILFLTSWYPTQNDPTHGIFIQNHAKALALFTNVVVVYAYSVQDNTGNDIRVNVEGNLTEVRLAYPKTNVTLPVAKQYTQFNNYLNAYKKLLCYLIDHQIKVTNIQLNVVFPAGMILNLFKDHFKVPHTIVEHWSGYLPEDGNYKGSIMKHYTKTCFKNASKVWYVSEKQKQALIAHGLEGDFELLYNAVDTNLFKIEPPVYNNPKLTFLHVSSLVEREKNLRGTFEAIKLVRERGHDFDVLIVGGKAPDMMRTMEIQNEVGTTPVNYTGYMDKEHIAGFMNQCDALLLFSHFEGMPVVVLEALACGMPVFASAVGHLPHLITNDLGRLSPTNDVQGFADLLENFILGKYYFDREKISRSVSDKVSFNAVGKQMWAFYSKQ